MASWCGISRTPRTGHSTMEYPLPSRHFTPNIGHRDAGVHQGSVVGHESRVWAIGGFGVLEPAGLFLAPLRHFGCSCGLLPQVLQIWNRTYHAAQVMEQLLEAVLGCATSSSSPPGHTGLLTFLCLKQGANQKYIYECACPCLPRTRAHAPVFTTPHAWLRPNRRRDLEVLRPGHLGLH